MEHPPASRPRASPHTELMQLYIAKNGKQTGPFSEAQVRSMLDGCLVGAADLCWREGLNTWFPVSHVLNTLAQAPATIPPLVPSQIGSSSHTAQHPGFWITFAAHLIDQIVVYVAAFGAGVMVFVLMTPLGVNEGIVGGAAYTVGGVVAWLYCALMESSSAQATLGKMACGFIVTDLRGNRISFGQATGRHFGMIVSALILCIGYLMCAWTERKQCLHDMMAGCLMFKK